MAGKTIFDLEPGASVSEAADDGITATGDGGAKSAAKPAGKRKPKSAGGSEPIDPAAAFAGTGDGAGSGAPSPGPGSGADGLGPTEAAPFGYFEDGRPRKRKPSTRTAKKRTGGKKGDISGLEKILLSTHGILAAGFNAQELAITEYEAKELASKIADVQEHYDAIIDPKTEAWLSLGLIVAMVYGPRLISLNNRLNSKASEKNKAEMQEATGEAQPQRPAPKPAGKSSAPSTPSELFGPQNIGG